MLGMGGGMIHMKYTSITFVRSRAEYPLIAYDRRRQGLGRVIDIFLTTPDQPMVLVPA